jgi:hypothetical protein
MTGAHSATGTCRPPNEINLRPRPKNAKRDYNRPSSHTKNQTKQYLKLSLRSVARDYNVPRQTLKDRFDGKQPRNKAQVNTMQLTHPEEKELARWITTLTERVMPLGIDLYEN